VIPVISGGLQIMKPCIMSFSLAVRVFKTYQIKSHRKNQQDATVQ